MIYEDNCGEGNEGKIPEISGKTFIGKGDGVETEVGNEENKEPVNDALQHPGDEIPVCKNRLILTRVVERWVFSFEVILLSLDYFCQSSVGFPHFHAVRTHFVVYVLVEHGTRDQRKRCEHEVV